ncbi:hypothetical protein RK21_01419 [Pseudomonas plecoglossicida]|nr:hypothetical protein RK21_01419 [Pseudomonas plecoglossicida]
MGPLCGPSRHKAAPTGTALQSKSVMSCGSGLVSRWGAKHPESQRKLRSGQYSP